MSKYKITVWMNGGANNYSENRESIDLIDDWGLTEKEAKNITKKILKKFGENGTTIILIGE